MGCFFPLSLSSPCCSVLRICHQVLGRLAHVLSFVEPTESLTKMVHHHHHFIRAYRSPFVENRNLPSGRLINQSLGHGLAEGPHGEREHARTHAPQTHAHGKVRTGRKSKRKSEHGWAGALTRRSGTKMTPAGGYGVGRGTIGCVKPGGQRN